MIQHNSCLSYHMLTYISPDLGNSPLDGHYPAFDPA